MAGYQLGISVISAANGTGMLVDATRRFSTCYMAGIAEPRVRFTIQHADWVFLVVSGIGTWRHCIRQSVAIVAAILWFWVCSGTAG